MSTKNAKLQPTRDERDERIAPKSRPKGQTFKQAVASVRKAAKAEAEAPKAAPKAVKPKREPLTPKPNTTIRVRLTITFGDTVPDTEAALREAIEQELANGGLAQEYSVDAVAVTRVREATDAAE